MKPRTLVAAGFALLTLAATAHAQSDYRPATPDELDRRDRLSLELYDGAGLKSDEVRSLDTLLLTYVQQGGNARELSNLIATAVKHRCRNTCLREAVRQLNGALADGIDLGDARQLVARVIAREARAAKRQRWSEAELAEHLRDAARSARADYRRPPSRDIQRVRGVDDRPRKHR